MVVFRLLASDIIGDWGLASVGSSGPLLLPPVLHILTIFRSYQCERTC